MQQCPCGISKTYQECCEGYISGLKKPTTPEALMRSRYTAYTQANVDYIAATMKSPASDNFDVKAAKEWAARVEWLKLEVVKASIDGKVGHVEFLAHFKDANKKHLIHELSEFHLIDDTWFYVDGQQPKILPRHTTKLAGRNEPCGCGSGVKFKRCCGSL